MLSVSTKTGDGGTTGLANGQRLGKNELVFDALGAVDELNSWIGLVIAKLDTTVLRHKPALLQIQDDLFYIGAELAQSPKTSFPPEALVRIEKDSDALQASMTEGWTTKFLYPGGTEPAATLDVARTICRRLERVTISLAQQQKVSPTILKYLNRLSDYMFVMRCEINLAEGYPETKFETNDTYLGKVFGK